jgi:hypothetical protein
MTDSKYNKGTLGWIREQQKIKANKDGFDNIDDWKKWKIDLLDFYKNLEYNYGKDFANWARENRNKIPDAYLKAGCKNWKEYFDKNAKSSGFKDYNERQKLKSWENGTKSPADENFDCPFYLSDKTEEYFKKYLLNYFEYVRRSEKLSHDGGIDIYCKGPKQKSIGIYQLDQYKEYHFQIKARCIYYDPTGNYSIWKFPIRTNKNNIPDFWIFVGLLDRDEIIEDNIIPEHSWLIYRDEIIDNHKTKGMKLYERDTISVTNSTKILSKYRKYEI